ncbi:hypothetical protein DPMN_184791 [Dreissena polymorpha]|uniref:Uncharacterized protein n=1 Tax=Dreissena polymorpha TaxID=45954 RepID=A0A9D4DK84_DREPO|nr:hypothetical protein DPMN_184696 [Dreissena polymorpha]KAH3750189.1 hypothetical protein DPMN_184708 [Dreissena polymorpha]KAH3750271.1 hypothetical protein DPMN_184791 [Dreissena polymorpha]
MLLPMLLKVKRLSDGQIICVTLEHGAGGLIVGHMVSVQLGDLRELGLTYVTLVAALCNTMLCCEIHGCTVKYKAAL